MPPATPETSATCDLHLRWSGRSLTGRFRECNQDALYAADNALVLADGVGGGPQGDLAALLVVTELARRLSVALPSSDRELRTMIASANDEITRAIRRTPTLRGTATTLSVALIGPTHALIANVGDSRVYLVRNGQLHQLSRDDSWVQQLVDTGQLDATAARRHPQRNVIMHSLSGQPTDPAHVTIDSLEVRVGDRWLLISDGVSDYLEDHQILASILAGTPRQASDRLTRAAEQAGSRDNISALVADVVHGQASGRTLFAGAAQAGPAAPGATLAG